MTFSINPLSPHRNNFRLRSSAAQMCCSLQGAWSGALSCTWRFWWGGEIQPLSSTPVKRRTKCSAQSLAVQSQWAQSSRKSWCMLLVWLSALGLRAGAGRWWEGTTHSKGKPSCGQLTLAAGGNTRYSEMLTRECSQLDFVIVPISQFTSEFKLLPAPEDNSLQKDRDLLSEICR